MVLAARARFGSSLPAGCRAVAGKDLARAGCAARAGPAWAGPGPAPTG